MSNLDYYLLEDHTARQRTAVIGIAVGATTGVVLQVLGFSLNVTAIACFALAGVVEITRALTYKQIQHKVRKVTPIVSLRRELLQGLLSAVALLILSLLRSPRIEAAVVERRLIQATAGPPPYDKANKLIRSAIDNDVPVSLNSIDVAKRQVARNLTAEPALTQEKDSANPTFAQLDAYAIYRITGVKLNLPLPRVVVLLDIYDINGAIHVNWGPVIGRDRDHSGIRAADFDVTKAPAILSYEGGGERDAYVAHLTASSARSGNPVLHPAFIQRDSSSSKLAVFDVTVSDLSQTLDEIIWVDVTFADCRITYNGGRVLMKTVVFNNCEFTSGNEAARTLLEQIRLQGTKPVTLAVP